MGTSRLSIGSSLWFEFQPTLICVKEGRRAANNGGGFDAPNWSVRVPFANRPDETYDDVGRGVRAVVWGYVRSCQAQGGKVGEIKLGR